MNESDFDDTKTEWVKFGKLKRITFVGKDYICMGSGCYMTFIDLNTKKEILYHANGKTKGEAVSAIEGHKTLPIFAFSEKSFFPLIYVKTCPNFTEICRLDKGSSEDYLSFSFSDGDYLITLSDIPSFEIILWNWRAEQKIASIPSEILGKFQIIRSNLNLSTNFAQLQTGSQKLYLWDSLLCGKKCVFLPHKTTVPGDAGTFSDMLWTTEGTLFILDMLGHVYTVGLDYNLSPVIRWPKKGKLVTSFVWFKAGLLVAGPNGSIKHFKKTGSWVCDWTINPPAPVKKLLSNYGDGLIGITVDNDILEYNNSECVFQYIKQFQSKFNDVCLIYPAGQYFVTLQQFKKVNLWEVATGAKKASKQLKHKVLAIKENPEYPYVGVAYNNGVLELLSLHNPKVINLMTTFNLSKNPLNSIYFTNVGKLMIAADTVLGEFFIIEGIPGTQMQIIATLHTHRQICDYMLVPSRTCMRLFVIYVTSDLYIAGDVIARYCISRDKPNSEVKEYRFETKEQVYWKIYAKTEENRDREFYAMSLNSKCLHELVTARGDSLARLKSVASSNHLMKKIVYHFDQHHVVSFAYDGLVIVRTVSPRKLVAIVMPHYRNYAGVFKAYVDPLTKYIVSLGRDNTLVCTSLRKIHVSLKQRLQFYETVNSEKIKNMFEKPTLGFTPTGELHKKTWLEAEKILREQKEREECKEERNSILEEFKLIQAEVQQLLSANLDGPDNEKLDVQEFNLDVDLKNRKIEESRETCTNTKEYLEALIQAQDNVSNWLKNFCWNKMKVQGQEIRAIFQNFFVNNYVLLPSDDGVPKYELEVMQAVRKLEMQMSKEDIFEPWVPKSRSEMALQLQQSPRLLDYHPKQNFLELLEMEDEPEKEIDEDTDTAFKGTLSHKFVDLESGHYTQQQIQTFLQTRITNIFSLVEINKVKEYFNKTFAAMMANKQREMGLVFDRNARLRHIISELNFFSVDKITILVENPEWSPSEFPESVLKVEANEVGIAPYISPSEQAILDAKAAEEERIRLLLLADDFRERALMVMMNGVLETRWEDEIKKDVPKPKCMLEKEPEEFNEEDLRSVRDYEEDVKFLNNERQRYKKMLEAEYIKICNNLRDSTKKFNRRLADCIITKLQVDSSIRQENLKMSRLRLINNRRIAANKKEVELIEAIQENQDDVKDMLGRISSLQQIVVQLRGNIEAIQTKDRLLEKAFRKEFAEASPVIQEQATKLYKRRPKVSMQTIPTTTLTVEVAKCLNSQQRTIILTQDCLEFFKSCDTLDLYVNVPPAVDEPTYAIICKHRRLKIELELKTKAAQMEITEAEATVSTFQRQLFRLREKGEKLNFDLDEVRTTRLQTFRDMEIQLVIKQGFVEIPTSGNIADFDDAIMVSRKDVDTINQIILKGGNKKIKAMKETMNFRRHILLMEWEHRRLQMRIEDLHAYLEEIDSITVTKEIQKYLKFRARGDAPDKGLSFEEEVELVRASYERIINDKKIKVEELQQKINAKKRENKRLDEQIAAVNVDVCEYELEVDYEMEQREKDIIKIRMATLLKRSKLVKQIQKNHSDILMLQTELELLRLKTYPTLSYTIFP